MQGSFATLSPIQMNPFVLEARASALDALVLPVFRHQSGDPPPRGIARFCSAKDEDEALLLARLFQSLKSG